MKINNDSIVSTKSTKLDAETLEAFGINTITKPPKGYYSIEELCNGLKICERSIHRKLENLKKQNKLDVVIIYTRNKANTMCYKRYYKVKK